MSGPIEPGLATGCDTPCRLRDLAVTALGVGGLFVSGMAAQVSLLLAPLGATTVSLARP